VIDLIDYTAPCDPPHICGRRVRHPSFCYRRGRRGGRRKQWQNIEHCDGLLPCLEESGNSNSQDFFQIPAITSQHRTRDRDNVLNVRKSNLRQLPHRDPLKCSVKLWNAHSVCNKTTSISDFVIDHDVDILCITETWLSTNDTVIIGELTPTGYSFLNHPRCTSRHGGIGILFKTSLKLTVKPIDFIAKTFEYMCITNGSNSITYAVIYRPPPSTENGLKTCDFLTEINSFLVEINLLPMNIVVLGDFNLHLDTPNKPEVTNFINTLTSINMQQHVINPTHKYGHVLDLVITRAGDLGLTSNHLVSRILESDHYVVSFDLNQTKPNHQRTTSSVRNFSDIDIAVFQEELTLILDEAVTPTDTDVNTAMENFNNAIVSVLDKHAPTRTKTRTIRPKHRWYNENIHEARRLRRQLERALRKHETEINRQRYLSQHQRVIELVHKAKKEFYSSELQFADTKHMFQITNTLLNRNEKFLPPCVSADHLANQFAHYFENKIIQIRHNLDNITNVPNLNIPSNFIHEHDVNALTNFKPVDEDEIRKIISHLSNKSCSLDAMPAWMVKMCIDVIVPKLTLIVNLSLSTGIFPDILKQAIITPILKKPSLDSNQLKNYRPVSNIPMWSKVIEKAIASRLNDHLSSNNLNETFQSAYRSMHSTETALLKVKNDILCALDQRRAVFVVLLDLSAAFDTVEYTILLNRLSTTFCINDTALQWFSSYLHGRRNRVKITGSYSLEHKMTFGLPQGSVIGPMGFSIYTYPLGKLISRHGVRYHMYADDTQLYVDFDPHKHGEKENALDKLTSCISDILLWMCNNKLKINADKTEFFIAASKRNLSQLQDISLTVGNSTIQPTSTIRNLGVVFDSEMSMSPQVTSICRSTNFHLRNIARIRKYIDQDTCHNVVRSLVTSRLDYCNSLLYGVTKENLKRLTSIQYRAAKLILTVNCRRAHGSPLLVQLHWLPIEQRILFKTLLYVFKCMHESAPPYLANLFELYKTARRGLRSSSDTTRLHVPISRLACGKHSFSHSAAPLWNNLPINIRESPSIVTFKCNLKTHLFPKE